ncbi:NlpC/P60 family protein [Sphingomonas sp.]
MGATAIPARPFAAPTHNRHALTGRSVAIDPRVQAARADLTDIRLCDRVFAPHYAAPVTRTALGIAAVRSEPQAGAPVLSQLLPGDDFEMLELSEALAWGISTTDGAVGYVDAVALGDYSPATHRVVRNLAAVREAPDRNAVGLATLPLGARIAALDERDPFLLTDHGYVALADIAPLDRIATADITAVARSLAGIAACPGGRSGTGVDAAGLVFLALDLCGLSCPRFLDLQRETLGVVIEGQPSPGDLLFFADHAAILVDSDQALHVGDRASVVEPVEALAARHGPIAAVRRIA